MAIDPLTGLQIAGITEIKPKPDGSAIVVKAVALVDQKRTELEIAITTEIAPAVAIALLATTATARAGRDDLDPALECIAADVSIEPVESDEQKKLRLKLLFDKGAVLPVEMPIASAERLSERLEGVLTSEDPPTP